MHAPDSTQPSAPAAPAAPVIPPEDDPFGDGAPDVEQLPPPTGAQPAAGAKASERPQTQGPSRPETPRTQRAATGPGQPRQLVFRTARERAKERPPKIEWVIEGIAAGGLITELDGPQKQSGKTTFVAHAVAAKLDGKPFLGRPTTTGPVVWLTEESWSTLQEPLREVGLLDRDDLYILCREDAFGTPWAEVARQAREFTSKVGANLLVGDTLSSLAGLKGDEENSSGAALEAVRPVQEIAATGVAVWITRHDRRAGGEVGDSGRGSTAFTGAVDMVFRLTRLGGEGRATLRRLEYIGRVRGIRESLVIDLVPGSGYQVVGTTADVKRREAEDLVFEHLPDAEEEACTLPSLWAQADAEKARPAGPLAACGIGKTTLREAAEALLKAGRVARNDISPRRQVWWRVSGGSGGAGHAGNESVGETGGRDVSGPSTHLRGGRTQDTPGQADSSAPSNDGRARSSPPPTGHVPRCPTCGAVVVCSQPDDGYCGTCKAYVRPVYAQEATA